MVFSSYFFLTFFLPVFLVVYYLIPIKFGKKLFFAVASFVFYAWSSPKIALFMTLSAFLDVVVSRKFKSRSKKFWFIFGISYNLGLLAYFKYAMFVAGEISQIGEFFGFAPFTIGQILLPAGISFFVFEKISYLADVYREDAEAASSFTEYFLFIALFPHIISGPLLQYHHTAPQISNPDHSLNNFYAGFKRFSIGLAKKVLIADALAPVVSAVFSADPETLTQFSLIMGGIFYAMQLYMDFAGYTDMAIGLGYMVGLKLPENFAHPYSTTTITEFWRSWHVSFFQWLSRYLYFPLGGSKFGQTKTIRNIFLVFLISGIWHGANWTFILWGVYHGVLVIIERLCGGGIFRKLPVFLAVIFNFILVLIGWVFFRSDNISSAWTMLCGMFFGTDGHTRFVEYLEPRVLIAFLIALFYSFIFPFVFKSKSVKAFSMAKGGEAQDSNLSLEIEKQQLSLLKTIILALIYIICLIDCGANSYRPFLYFQF